MKHPHAEALFKVYSNFSEGNISAMLAVCSDNFSFQVAGKSPVAGKFTKTNFEAGFVKKLKEISGGSYKFEAHDILASDLHGTVLGSMKITIAGKATELRVVHVWRFENGKPMAGYEYQRDLYQYDALLG